MLVFSSHNLMLLLAGSTFFLVMDYVWLQVIMGDVYAYELRAFLLTSPKILPAIFVYLCMTLSILIFVLPHRTRNESMIMGALLGFLIYGIYEGTNYALLSGWPFTIVLIDILWGSFLYAMGSALLHHLSHKVRF